MRIKIILASVGTGETSPLPSSLAAWQPHPLPLKPLTCIVLETGKPQLQLLGAAEEGGNGFSRVQHLSALWAGWPSPGA